MRDTNIDESTIKPCPYCGHEGHLIHWGNLWHVSHEGHLLHLEDAWYVSCERYHCNNPYLYPRETPEDAIDAWNKIEVRDEG